MGRYVLVGVMLVAGVAAGAQAPLFLDKKPTLSQAQVEYLYPEQITLPPGKSTTVQLHFRVAHGLHINSHAPKDKFLIPTTFSVPDGAGVRLDGAAYPAGTDFTLPADPKTKLNVYTGEFTIEARLTATAGSRLLEGKLRYQACDQTQCMPPRTITVPIDVTVK